MFSSNELLVDAKWSLSYKILIDMDAIRSGPIQLVFAAFFSHIFVVHAVVEEDMTEQ